MDEREVRDRANEAHEFFGQAGEYFRRVADREKVEDRRHAELVRVHQQGWAMLANAVGKGLADIADAIRRSR